jgi:acyl-CoA synthetase (AMP-forming)/AMP-acid ligase II
VPIPRVPTMLWPLRWFCWLVLRALVGCRYRLSIAAPPPGPGPYLILPNHPGYSDPPTVLAALWPRYRPRPMLLESNFENLLLKPLAWLMRAIKVPETEKAKASAEVRERAAGAVQEVIAALRAGDNVILWPTGTLSRDGTDRLGAARTAADVLAAVPEATLLLVKTRGIWGSRFSWAYGTKPRMMPQMFRALAILASNLFVLTPKRRVSLTLAAFPRENRPAPERATLNPWLEAWYNSDAPETPHYVPYHILFGPRTAEYPPPYRAPEIDAEGVPANVKADVVHVVEEKIRRPLVGEELRDNTPLADLGLDSLEAAELGLAVEHRFGFGGDAVPVTLGELYLLAAGKVAKGPPKPPPPAWFSPPSDTRALEILGETIPEAFLRRATLHPKDVAAADDLAGVLNYERLLIGALTMAERFRALPGDAVALMLPAAVGADVAFLGLQLAGKLTVLLNWTTGPAAMAHGVKITGVTKVITSKAFIDRTGVTVPGAEYIFLEDVRKGVGKLELLLRLLNVRFFSAGTVRNVLGRLPNDPNRPAVVLFTSGSEKAPKAVPLTHRNIISDQRGAVPPQELTRADSILSFLPLFHSFGLTIAGLFPLLAGVKVVHHPDPTDSASLARKLAGYRPSIVCGTPTFAAMIVARLKPGELDSLRIFVVGAEKCPDELFDAVAALNPKARVLEGYGVTECSPCVSVNPVWAVKRGTIGQPLPGVTVVAVSEDGTILGPNRRGLLHVAGPTVFPGYLAHDGEQPFATINGVTYYNTGDLGELDDENYIHFHGRLKRFLKAAGEMISLPALEEPFTRLFPPTADGPRAAVEGIELPGTRKIVLFTTDDYSLKDANAVLNAEGFRGVMRLDEVRRIEKIPVLGTGKTDYKQLRAMVES